MVSSERAPLLQAQLYPSSGPPIAWSRTSVLTETTPPTAIHYTTGQSGCLRRKPAQRLETPLPPDTAYPSSFRDIRGLRLLVVVNGAAGRGKAVGLIDSVCRPVFEEAGLVVDVRKTSGPGDGVGIVRNALKVGDSREEPVSAFDVVVAAGGDGTVCEVLNGLVQAMEDNVGDLEGVLPLLGVIPCGSGNAISVSVGVKTPLDAALNIVSSLRTRSSTSMAVLEYGPVHEDGDGPRAGLSLCGLQWGLVADADLGTERLRWMGDLRFDVGGAAGILGNKGKFAKVQLKMSESGQARVDEALRDGGGGSRGRKELRGMSSDVVLEDTFVTVVAWNVSHQAAKTAMTPYAEVGEECFDVVLCRKGALGRGGMLKMMLEMSEGGDGYLKKSRGMEYYKCTRISLEGRVALGATTGPDGKHMSIDGERIPMEAVYLRLAPETGIVRLLKERDTV